MVKLNTSSRETDDSLLQRVDPIVALSKIAAPFTTVVNRALMTNMANDLQPRFGINRVTTQQIMEVQGEQGPNGERVFKPINDVHDQVRFIGSWTNSNAIFGPGLVAPLGDSVEISFYGTGLNILSFGDNSIRTVSVTTDGVLGASVSLTTAATSTALNGRNYAVNIAINLVTGLTAGFHTVKLICTAGSILAHGFEILNSSSSLTMLPGTSYLGGKRLYKSALSTDSYNSNFESGVLGTLGGHVVIYQKADGTIGKAVTPTNASAAYLTSASHANEEIIRTYHWREFGCGRNTANAGQAFDDFSSLTTTNSTRAFTLDDGTTALAGSLSSASSSEFLVFGGNANQFVTFTFVGTGLDFVRQDTANAALDSHSISIDGVLVGAITGTGSTSIRTQKVASGLPYGTHTCKINRDAFVNNRVDLSQLIVYGPSKPSIPSGAVEIADYYLMADYSVSTSSAINFIAPGLLRKFSTREFVYSGTWVINAVDVINFDGGLEVETSTATSFMQHVDFGSGYEFRGYVGNTHVVNATFTVDGLALNAGSNIGSTVSLIATGITGLSLSAAGVLTGTVTGAGEIIVRVSGLTLGLHTFKYLQNGATVSPRVVALDIITPVHSQKSSLPGDVQNTLPVGSQALSDNRKFSSTAVKPLANWAQAVGVTSSPTTTSTVFIPLPDLSLTIKTSGNPIEIFYSSVLNNSAVTSVMLLQAYVDGAAVGTSRNFNSPVANYNESMSDSIFIPVAAGVHKIDLYWSVSAGTGTATSRILKAREI